MRLPFMQVDAFTSTPLQGNPCAVIFEADGLAEEQMLAVAREMNLSETAFVLASEQADVRARYFTPAAEIPLAGHPTIATLYALVETGRLPVADGATTVRLELEAGVIPVEVQVEKGRARQVIMSQLRPQFLASYAPAEVLPAFGLEPEAARADLPLQTVSTGTPQLMVPLREQEALRRAQIDPPAYRALKEKADFFSVHLFCMQGFTPAGATSARHLGLPPEPPEDPFTGSATGNMGAYLWRYGLLREPIFVAEQGHWMHRPGQATVEVVGPRHDISTVRVGGEAVAVLDGELRL
ncbi:MAG: PhzF family phenazine biosynthesis protein [Chloroflexi bacterium]|nr:PhzF family phenazine biosynthesis protein [Chloroflexota bacterium]